MSTTKKPAAQKRKTWPWVRATQSAGGNQSEKRRQEEGRLWRKVIKQRMDGWWEANRLAQREDRVQPRSGNGRWGLTHP